MTRYVIRPLKWEPDEDSDALIAQSILGDIEVFGGPDRWWYSFGDVTKRGRFKSVGEAQAAAETAYRKVVLTALAPSAGQRELFTEESV